MSKIDIYCTLGPSSINKKFLRYINGKVSLVRLNMSHLDIKKLTETINFIKKNCSVPICIDTEGAQIRSKVRVKRRYKKNQKIILNRVKGNFNLYPENIFKKLKKKDCLDIGFDGLEAKVIKKDKNKIYLSCLKDGLLENNKGIHIKNRKVKMNYVTKKDIEAIIIAKKLHIKNFALSFTSSASDVIKFSKLLPASKKIYKIETLIAMKNLKSLFKKGKNFLIDRGDLSKDIGIENVPVAQRHIFKVKKKFINRKVSIATNFLESMIEKPFPTRAEVNDIFNALEMGANGLVLAAETAVGKHPKECVDLIRKIIKAYKNQNKKFLK